MRPKQIKAIELLAEGRTQSEVARLTGVSERTLRNWLKEESFREALTEKTKEIVNQELLRLSRSENDSRIRQLCKLIDESLKDLDLSNPYAVDVLVKYLKVLLDAESKRKELLLKVQEKLGEETTEELKTINIVITRDADNP